MKLSIVRIIAFKKHTNSSTFQLNMLADMQIQITWDIVSVLVQHTTPSCWHSKSTCHNEHERNERFHFESEKRQSKWIFAEIISRKWKRVEKSNREKNRIHLLTKNKKSIQFQPDILRSSNWWIFHKRNPLYIHVPQCVHFTYFAYVWHLFNFYAITK